MASSDSPEKKSSSKKTAGSESPAELRARLNALVLSAQELVKGAMSQYETNEERTVADRLALCRQLLTDLSEVCEEAGWSESRLLERLIQPIRNTYASLEALAKRLEKELSGGAASARGLSWMRRSSSVTVEPKGGLKKVYIALFQMNGADMPKWYEQLENLDRALITRPVYDSEEAVQAAIRARKNQDSLAYVCVNIPLRLVLETDEPRMDRLQQPLLALTSGHVDVEAVDYFVYGGCCYRVQDEKLQEIDDNG